MKKITLLILCLGIIKSNAQSSNWTKDDRNNLYSDCMSYTTKYKTISGEQKESICLCYLEETTKKYIKTDFEAKIDIEIKRIKEAMLTQCAKNIGVELNSQVKEEIVKEEIKDVVKSEKIKTIVAKENLTGKWKTDKGNIIEFKEGGKYSETLLSGSLIPGDWFLDEDGTLTINTEYHYQQLITKKQKVDRYSYKYNVEHFTKDFLKYTKEGGVAETIQANRIK